MKQKVFGFTGWKNSGKTGVTVRIVEELTRRGWRISTIKHAHHAFDIDHEGTETRRIGSGSREPLAPGNPSVVAIAADHPVDSQGLPFFDLDDTRAIADFIEIHTGLVDKGKP